MRLKYDYMELVNSILFVLLILSRILLMQRGGLISLWLYKENKLRD
jgi:hypothetical protein